jgi:release factor glutamine methyltransferase
MRNFYYIFYNAFYKYILKLYLKTDSNVRFDGFRLRVFKDVFHPKLFFSTKYFYSFLKEQDFNQRHFLEIGSGSGILSLLAKRKGAFVTAVDIDPRAVENTKINFKNNFVTNRNTTIIQSDLFENIPVQTFDVIAINPPYYFKKVETDSQYAWYCGENGEYFEELFLNLSRYINSASCAFMILEENCEIERMKSIALKNNVRFELVHEKLIRWERNYIYKLNVN